MNYLVEDDFLLMKCLVEQRFSTGGTRTTGGTPDVAKWYAKK